MLEFISKKGEVSCSILEKIHDSSFIEALSEPERLEIQGLKHADRKLEYLVVRKLKSNLFGAAQIMYSKTGKPFLENLEQEIGISHSKHWVLFANSLHPFGCDIEEVSERILTVGERFCSQNELDIMRPNNHVNKLTILWSCKESIYKLIETPGVHWKDQMIYATAEGDFLIFECNTSKGKKQVRCEVYENPDYVITIATYV